MTSFRVHIAILLLLAMRIHTTISKLIDIPVDKSPSDIKFIDNRNPPEGTSKTLNAVEISPKLTSSLLENEQITDKKYSDLATVISDFKTAISHFDTSPAVDSRNVPIAPMAPLAPVAETPVDVNADTRRLQPTMRNKDRFVYFNFALKGSQKDSIAAGKDKHHGHLFDIPPDDPDSIGDEKDTAEFIDNNDSSQSVDASLSPSEDDGASYDYSGTEHGSEEQSRHVPRGNRGKLEGINARRRNELEKYMKLLGDEESNKLSNSMSSSASNPTPPHDVNNRSNGLSSQTPPSSEQSEDDSAENASGARLKEAVQTFVKLGDEDKNEKDETVYGFKKGGFFQINEERKRWMIHKINEMDRLRWLIKEMERVRDE